ncbi:hypothetical protein Emed_006697 [Eimeria media]
MATPFAAGVPSGGTPVDASVVAAQAALLSPANLAAAARCMYTRIDSFTGEFKFLSLDYPSLIFFQGRFFPSARHALLAAKHPKAVDELASIEDMKELKQLAKNKEEDPDWPRYRLKWMELIQRDKFRRNADIREKLKQTGGRELVWLNTGDSFFGQTGLNRGQNHLGRILMEIRQNILEDTELEWKLADNDLVALNPSVSRRHAALVVLKGGHVLLTDLKSKAKTFKNGMPLDHDHVGVQMQTNDSFSLGASSRHYLLEIDTTSVVDYLQRRGRELNRELSMLNDQVFVGGLAYSTSRYDLCELFAEIGGIKSIVIPQVDRSIPSDYEGAYCVRGIAFVEFEDAEGAKKALECAGRMVNGRSVVVCLQKDTTTSSSRSSSNSSSSTSTSNNNSSSSSTSSSISSSNNGSSSSIECNVLLVTPAKLTREERAAQEELMVSGGPNGGPLLRASPGRASCVTTGADGEMNFVAATSKTFDHPTHGSMRGPQVDDEAAAAAAQKSLLLAADPLTGEPMDRSGRGKWEHDDREGETSGQHRPLTNAELRRLQGGGRGDGAGVGMRSETEGAREARMAAAVAAAAAAAGGDRGGGSAGFDDDAAAERRDKKHRRRSRSRSRSHSGERRRHKSSRKRSRSR